MEAPHHSNSNMISLLGLEYPCFLPVHDEACRKQIRILSHLEGLTLVHIRRKGARSNIIVEFFGAKEKCRCTIFPIQPPGVVLQCHCGRHHGGEEIGTPSVASPHEAFKVGRKAFLKGTQTRHKCRASQKEARKALRD